MTSWAQFQANRRNALKSTGPRTEEGRSRSRINAVRHGLTAETVIAALEEADDYKTFEAAVIADYDARTAVAMLAELQPIGRNRLTINPRCAPYAGAA